ncbi:MAG: methyl-accepting chemotaxis protein [Hormoscilla sp.]
MLEKSASPSSGRSLRTKVVAAAIALGTLPVLVIGGVAYHFTNQTITRQVLESKKVNAVNLADNVNQFILERYGDIQVLARLPIFVDPRIRKTAPFQQKEDLLNSFIQAYSVYDSIAVFDLKGDIIVKSSGEAIGNHSDRNYFQEVLQTDRPFVSEPQLSKTTGGLAIYMALPIKDTATGKTIAIVRSRMPIKALEQLVSSVSSEDHLHLVDASGKFIIGHEPSEFGKNIEREYSDFAEIAVRPDAIITNNHLTQEKIVLAAAPTTELANRLSLNWVAVIEIEREVALAASNQLLLTISMGTLVIALVVGAIAALLSIFFTEPLVQRIDKIVDIIAKVAAEIAAAVEQREEAVTNQASSVNETTTTIDELGASSRQVAQQAEAAASGAQQALNLARGGTAAVERTLEEMGELKEKVGAIAQQISLLSTQTDQIGNISVLVSDLASQTNMLALNAAVEAVRAGEHGRGFAVVASEIRKLADQSKKSAARISELVTDLQSSINSTVIVTSSGSKKVESGVEIAHQTADAFTGVAEAVNDVVLNNQQISFNIKQQAIAISKVVEAMNVINQEAKETTSSIGQTKLGTQKLKNTAEELKRIV